MIVLVIGSTPALGKAVGLFTLQNNCEDLKTGQRPRQILLVTSTTRACSFNNPSAPYSSRAITPSASTDESRLFQKVSWGNQHQFCLTHSFWHSLPRRDLNLNGRLLNGKLCERYNFEYDVLVPTTRRTMGSQLP